MKVTAVDLKNKDKFTYLIERSWDMFRRVTLLDWLTVRQRPMIDLDSATGHNVVELSELTPEECTKLVQHAVFHASKQKVQSIDDALVDPSESIIAYGVSAPSLEHQSDKLYLYKLGDHSLIPPFRPWERFTIRNGDILNYTGEPLVTDVGKFLMNRLLLVDPFGGLIPYRNTTFDPGELDDMVATMILDGKVGRTEYNKYMNNGYWFGEDCSLATATWSMKSLTTDPNVKKRRDELLAKYKDQLDDPLVVSRIERELIDMDKAWLKDDTSAPFYHVEGKKTWDEHRKKMYLMVGQGQAFDKNAGKYTFAKDSLEEGWQVANLDIASNQVRRGSYGRGKETANGGVEAKFVLRVFQETSVEEEDCHSTRGMLILLHEGNIKKFYGRYLVSGEVINKDTAKKFLGKIVKMRSPMYCNTKNGYCYRCCGDFVKRLGIKRIGMQAISVTANYIMMSMKAQHQSATSSTVIKDFKKYLR